MSFDIFPRKKNLVHLNWTITLSELSSIIAKSLIKGTKSHCTSRHPIALQLPFLWQNSETLFHGKCSLGVSIWAGNRKYNSQTANHVKQTNTFHIYSLNLLPRFPSPSGWGGKTVWYHEVNYIQFQKQQRKRHKLVNYPARLFMNDGCTVSTMRTHFKVIIDSNRYTSYYFVAQFNYKLNGNCFSLYPPLTPCKSFKQIPEILSRVPHTKKPILIAVTHPKEI